MTGFIGVYSAGLLVIVILTTCFAASPPRSPIVETVRFGVILSAFWFVVLGFLKMTKEIIINL